MQEILKKRTVSNYSRLIGDANLLIIDEAQSIPEIGSILKLIIDSQPQLTIIATGSSSLDLVNHICEPLTGRNYPFNLYPVAQMELNENMVTIKSKLDERLILGSYPEIFQFKTTHEKEFYLKELVKSYLLKDILAYAGIKHSNKLVDLLRLIAFQIGSEVSYSELSMKLGLNKITIENYLDLLQKVFIIFKIPSFSTNQRKEISKGSKWYFHDNVIRNALIQDFRISSLRNEMGILWENYIISERLKRNAYLEENIQMYFWRNYHQQEIDLVEVHNNIITAFEIKYSNKSKVKLPPAFKSSYENVEFKVVNPDNYLDFIY